MTHSSPVALFARPVGSPLDTEQTRLVVPVAALQQIERALQMHEDATHLPSTFAEVLDLASRQRVRIRRANCGFACACALEWWPVSRTDPVPPAEEWDFPERHFDEQG